MKCLAARTGRLSPRFRYTVTPIPRGLAYHFSVRKLRASLLSVTLSLTVSPSLFLSLHLSPSHSFSHCHSLSLSLFLPLTLSPSFSPHPLVRAPLSGTAKKGVKFYGRSRSVGHDSGFARIRIDHRRHHHHPSG